VTLRGTGCQKYSSSVIPFSPGAELMIPVPVKLIEEFSVPVDVHPVTLESAIIRAPVVEAARLAHTS
jgi:hypothetical protein